MKHFIQISRVLAAKKLYLFVLVMLMSITGVQKANAAKEIYAALSGSTMTLYYDDQKASRPGVLDKWSPGLGTTSVPEETSNSITKAVINASMVDASPTSTFRWFNSLANLTTIEGLANLNTANVTSMSEMFVGCSSLTSLNVSNFNTDNVTDMSYMFYGCTSLTSLNVSNFNTSNVTNMSSMFYGCTSLSSLDVSNFNTAKVTDMRYMFAYCSSLTSLDVSSFNTDNVMPMSGMFRGCSSLTSLDVSSFNTAKVTDMRYMFDGCTSLTSLDISLFNTANVKNMNGMFNGCTSLKTIYCDDALNPSSSDNMFKNCTSLVGGKGTEYDAGKIDKTYARPDGLDDQPGYFTTTGGSKEIYAALSGSTMTLYYDDQKASRPGVLEKWSTDVGTFSVDKTDKESITTAVLDASMKYASPTNISFWFSELSHLATITGLNYLNTENVTYMWGTFTGCSALTELNLSSFNIGKVTTMDDMFSGCSSLKTIYCKDDWSTSAAQSDNMFSGCTSLVGGKGTEYDAGKIDKTYARPDGLGDQPGYFTTEIYAALSGSTMTIYYDDQKASRPGVLDKWSPDLGASYVPEETRNSITKAVISPSMVDARPTGTKLWFVSLANLTTIEGLAYLNTSEVTDMSGMFYGSSSLTSLNLSSFNTANVTSMACMFQDCFSLTSLDLSSFNTANVKNMSGMFYDCSSLTTIYCDDAWNPSSSDKMFSGCTSLVGGKGTKYDAGKIDKTYARPDGLGDQPGYFTTERPKEIYAALSGSTMTIYFDDQKASRPGVLDKWSPEDGMYSVPKETRNSITKAVIDASMVDASPTSTYRWFNSLANLTTIEGLANLNTANVTSMEIMFAYCSSLTSLDLSGFNTSNVTDMYAMFAYCSSLTSLNVSGFNTANVEYMSGMFQGCSSLTSLDVSNFNTANVMSMFDMFDVCSSLTSLDVSNFNTAKVVTMKNMFADCTSLTSLDLSNFNTANVEYLQGMFYGCSSLTSLDLSSFNTANVTDMRFMFEGCSSLTSLDLSSFNTSNVTTMNYMFSGCSSLKTIYCDDAWNPSSSDKMFSGCTSLVGGKGTKYDAGKIDKTYARPDGLDDQPGYFTTTVVLPNEIYATLNGSTMTIYYDDQKASHSDLLEKWTPEDGVDMDDATCNLITKAVIDASMVDARPTGTKWWFYKLTNLTTIEGLANLNTSEVTNMNGMFSYCYSLTSLDLSSFNTDNVTNMNGMFCFCSSLTSLDLSKFNTSNVTDMYYMFFECSSLTSLDLSNFNTANVNNMEGMFMYCSSLTSLDLSNFNTVNVNNMEGMFAGCESLKTIYCDDAWNPSSSDDMFGGCTSLVGGKGTKYDAGKTDKTYARPDGLGGQPGYFTAKSAPITPEEQKEIDAVIDLINAIGSPITLASEPAIVAARTAYDALTDVQKALVTNYSVLTDAEQAYADLKEVEIAKEQLKNIISEANQLKAVALIYAPSAVTALNDLIADAQSMIDDPSVTVDQVNTKAATLTGNLHTLAVNLLDQAKEQLKQSIIALFLPGDYPSWYGAVITPALNQVDGVTWDFNKSVNENIVFFQATGTQIYNDTKSALEALRASDTRSIVTACAFTGFEHAIHSDMTWNMAALTDLVNAINASVASEPYRLDVEMSSLGKWDPINATLVVLDPYAEEKLTAGDYQFVTAVKIDGEDAKQYRLPKATEEALSVSVDATPWTVDLSGIVIDATYCYTVVNSPMFTVSNVPTDVELINEDQLKTQKIFRDGHIYILRGDHIFDIRGTMVK